MALSQAIRGLISSGGVVLGQGLGQWQAAAGCGAASVLQKRAASSHAENTNTFLREVRSMCLSCCVAVWCCLGSWAPVEIQLSISQLSKTNQAQRTCIPVLMLFSFLFVYCNVCTACLLYSPLPRQLFRFHACELQWDTLDRFWWG